MTKDVYKRQGYTATFTFQIAFGSPKTYDLAMNVNKNRTITESNYNNNSKTHSVNVVIGGSRVCLDVPEYTQQPYDKICWATSAAMVISYFLDEMCIRDRIT